MEATRFHRNIVRHVIQEFQGASRKIGLISKIISLGIKKACRPLRWGFIGSRRTFGVQQKSQGFSALKSPALS
jgi:hypothetical protein